jgi:hypothetical protein
MENTVHIMLEEALQHLDKAIPSDLKENLKKPSFRKDLLKKVGRTAFLDADTLKFPIKDMDGKYVCQLIYAAYLRAKVNIGRPNRINGIPDSYYQSIANKAKILFKSNKCDEAMQIHLSEGDDIDYTSFFEFFDLSTITDKELFNYVENY